MTDILIVAINARYSHASLGARCLRANLGPLRDRSAILEFTLQDTPNSMAEQILETNPSLIAIGVYIWNRTETEGLVNKLRAARPDIPIVLGGPEISYDTDSRLAASATCVICGEADTTFRTACEKILAGETALGIMQPEQPDLTRIGLPYGEYSDDDITNRTIYAETSRGCAHGCEYCISSISPGVRRFDLSRLLPEFDMLLERGALRFKFVDRSFNLHQDHACAVLDFFIERWKDCMCLHLEMTPDNISHALRERLLKFPPGGLHIEVGIQTFNEDVARRVGRNTDFDIAAQGIDFLVNHAGADVHADLIAGLPGETPEIFEAGVNRLIALNPAEIQIGILKRLHGAPIERHVKEWDMRFRDTPPYDVLSTSTMNAEYIRKIRRFAMHWDRVVNRQWFPRTTALLLDLPPSPFQTFDLLSSLLAKELGLSGFGMVEASKVLFRYLTETCSVPESTVRQSLRDDYLADGRRINVPSFLRDTSP